jgi:hypothetical protein
MSEESTHTLRAFQEMHVMERSRGRFIIKGTQKLTTRTEDLTGVRTAESTRITIKKFHNSDIDLTIGMRRK